jgi:putative ABC transport system permease protein
MAILARKTLIYEWRKFLPSALAVAFSGLLLLMMTSLMFGIFSSAGVYVSKSSADIWAGYPGTQSVELGRPIPRDTEMWLRMDPDIVQVEPFQWLDGDWRGPVDRGGVSVFISGIDPKPDGLMFARVLDTRQRSLLFEPGSVIIDSADLGKLGMEIGNAATLNGHRVKIVAAAAGIRALGGVNIVTSLTTAYWLNDAAERDKAAYYVARLRPGADAQAAGSRLEALGASHHFAVWTSDRFAYNAATYWMFETGAGLGFMFLELIVFVVGVVVTSQTLFAAVTGSAREYAMLNALGAGLRALRHVILEQAFWVGTVGVVIGTALSIVIMLLAAAQDVPIIFNPIAATCCIVLVMSIALISGFLAAGVINHLEPATLLR